MNPVLLITLFFLNLLPMALPAQIEEKPQIYVHPSYHLDAEDFELMPDGHIFLVGNATHLGLPILREYIDENRYRILDLEIPSGPFLAKISPNGDFLWFRNLGEGIALHIDLAPDGNLAIAGYFNLTANKRYKGDRGDGVWAGEYTTEGQEVWRTEIQSDFSSTPSDILGLANGNTLVTASYEHPIEGYARPEQVRWILLDPKGTVHEENKHPRIGNFVGSKLVQDPRHGYMLLGSSYSGNVPSYSLGIQIIDSSLQNGHIWSYETGGNFNSNRETMGHAICKGAAGDFFLSGFQTSLPQGPFVSHFDAEGQKLWEISLEGDPFERSFLALRPDGSLGFVTSHKDNSETSIHFVKISPDGQISDKSQLKIGHTPRLSGLKSDHAGQFHLVGDCNFRVDLPESGDGPSGYPSRGIFLYQTP